MTLLRGLLAGAAVVVLAAWLMPWGDAQQAPAPQPLEPEAHSEQQAAKAATDIAAKPATSADVQQAGFVAEMRARFGPVIDRGHARVRLIEQVINYLRGRYPETWQSRVNALLAELFPARAAELQANFASLQQYNAWVRNNRQRVMALPADRRRAELWQARRAAFGPAADDIWAAELRNQAIASALDRIVRDGTGSLPEQASAWAQAVDSASAAEVSGSLLARRQTELLGRFVSQPAVQARLRELAPDQRRQTLRDVRQAMGMPDDALERWAALDDQRDRAWQAGRAYMQARADIVANAPSGDQARQLQALREQTFGDQAGVIAQEEAAGFFRYAGEREIGRE